MEWGVNNVFKTLKDLEPKTAMDITFLPEIEPLSGLGSSDKANVTSTGKPRKKTMTSVYLRYFETAVDGKSRKCKFCGQSYSIATATGNLGRHLSNRHPGYDKSTEVASTSSLLPNTVIKKEKSQPQPQQKQQQQLDYDHLNWLLIKWLVLSSLPPSTLEEEWLGNSFKFLNPSIQIWSVEKHLSALHEVFRSMQENLKASLEQVSSKLSIALDFWRSYEQIFYMSVTCQWIDESWSLQNILLDVCRIPYPCGGTEIYNSLAKVLKMYNIECRVLSCTHDNSQSAIHACQVLKEFMDDQKAGPFCFIPCAAQTLNRIIDDGLKSTKPLISKIRDFVLDMNSSVEIAEEFIQLTSAYREGTWKIPLDACSRWSGNYQMLEIVCKAGKSMDAVIRNRKYGEILESSMSLSSAEKNAVNIIHSFLDPFYKTTNNICTNEFPTVGLVLFFMDHISDTIATSRDSHQYPDWLKSASEEMAKKARSYSSQVCNIFTYMTAILDPRIKVELIPEELNSESYLEEARTHFMRNYTASHFSSITRPYNAHDIEDGGSVSFAEEIARKKRRASLNSVTDELTQYLSESPASIHTDVLEWWKVNSTRYPRLSLMARDFLAVQATSVPPEEVFCSKGDEIDKQRCSIPYNSAQALLCIRSWAQSGMGFKYKSIEIDYERLMELAAATGDRAPGNVDRKQR